MVGVVAEVAAGALSVRVHTRTSEVEKMRPLVALALCSAKGYNIPGIYLVQQ